MKVLISLQSYWVLGAIALMLHCIPALADELVPVATEETIRRAGPFDWLEHTQRTLNELKGKLNLAPVQMSEWVAWSDGVRRDAHQQLEKHKTPNEDKATEAKPLSDLTTPELMQRGIKRMHAEADWMQKHLIQLEAAQIRTQTFYAALDTNQRTIFDLFWHEMFHRSIGHDEGLGMPAPEDFNPVYMREENETPVGLN